MDPDVSACCEASFNKIKKTGKYICLDCGKACELVDTYYAVREPKTFAKMRSKALGIPVSKLKWRNEGKYQVRAEITHLHYFNVKAVNEQEAIQKAEVLIAQLPREPNTGPISYTTPEVNDRSLKSVVGQD